MSRVLESGLGGTVTADQLPVEYQRQDITAELTVPQIVEDLEAIVAWGLEVHDLLTAKENTGQAKIKAMEAASTYSNLTVEASRIIATIAAKQRLVAGSEAYPPEEADRLKRRYAKLQFNNMSLLAHAINYAREVGIVDFEGNIHYWVKKGMNSLMGSCVSNYRHWAQLLMLEEKRGKGGDHRLANIERGLIAKRRRKG